MKLKSERQIRKIRTALISGIALVAAGATVAPVTHAADITTGGIECVSNNLSQAINTPIIWDGFRVRNDSTTADRFVLCPIMNYVDIDGGVADLIDSVFITGWWGPNANAADDITCTVREIPVSGSGTPAGGDSVIVTLDSGGSVPSTDQVITTVSSAGFSVGVPIIASCRLPPGTGIQQLGAGNN